MSEAKAEPRLYSPVPTVIISIGIFIVSQLLAGILISVYPLLNGWDTKRAAHWFEGNVLVSFIFVALVEAIALGLIYYFLKKRQLSFRSIGISRPRYTHLGYALLGFVAYFVLYIVGLLLLKQLFPQLNIDQKQEIGFDTTTKGLALIPIFVSLVILAPISEEIAARGFLFGGLRTKLTFIWSALITSVLFAAAHLMQASDGLLWVAGIDTFILSLVLCYLREKTGSLWPSVVVHILKNSLAFMFLFNIVGYLR